MTPNVRLVASLLLIDLSILLLVLGHFVQLDASGSGSDDGSLPLGVLAAGLAIASVVVAMGDRRARRALGVLFLGGAAVLVVLQLALDGFRFVWAGGELELIGLEVVLACVGLVLLATGSHQAVVETMTGRTEPSPMSWTVRALLYLALTVVLVFVAGLVGMSYGDGQCVGAGDDCPEATAGSLLFASGALVAMVILVVSCEITLRSRRRRLAQ
jgi:hypothetical protein